VEKEEEEEEEEEDNDNKEMRRGNGFGGNGFGGDSFEVHIEQESRARQQQREHQDRVNMHRQERQSVMLAAHQPQTNGRSNGKQARPPGKPVICAICSQRFVSVSGKSSTCPQCRKRAQVSTYPKQLDR
jgi:hypothetical protein